MTDATGHYTRPGASPDSMPFAYREIPRNYYIHENPETKKIEFVKTMPPGTDDVVLQNFTDRVSAWEWGTSEFEAGRLT